MFTVNFVIVLTKLKRPFFLFQTFRVELTVRYPQS